jgi:hypothetical protein
LEIVARRIKLHKRNVLKSSAATSHAYAGLITDVQTFQRSQSPSSSIFIDPDGGDKEGL